MVKPFNPYELIARIKAMLRRRDRQKTDRTIYTYGCLQLDTVANKLLKDDLEVDLTPTEFSLLKGFYGKSGKSAEKRCAFGCCLGEKTISEILRLLMFISDD